LTWNDKCALAIILNKSGMPFSPPIRYQIQLHRAISLGNSKMNNKMEKKGEEQSIDLGPQLDETIWPCQKPNNQLEEISRGKTKFSILCF